MASTVAMQSILGSSMAYGACKSRSRMNQINNVSTVTYAPSYLHRFSHMRVRSMAEDGQKEQQACSVPSTLESLQIPAPSSPLPPRSPKISTKFSDVFAFSGPAPERINGRLAMVGFVAALAVELSKGQDVFAQLSHGGVSVFLGTSILLSVASLVPLLKGMTVESKSKGLMTSEAELWNGRLAMLGLVALAFTEYVTGGTLV